MFLRWVADDGGTVETGRDAVSSSALSFPTVGSKAGQIVSCTVVFVAHTCSVLTTLASCALWNSLMYEKVCCFGDSERGWVSLTTVPLGGRALLQGGRAPSNTTSSRTILSLVLLWP